MEVLIDIMSEDGELIGRSQWDAPDVDPIVFLSLPQDQHTNTHPRVGELWRCKIVGASLFDLEAVLLEQQ